jgi:uncharacterized membrane protein
MVKSLGTTKRERGQQASVVRFGIAIFLATVIICTIIPPAVQGFTEGLTGIAGIYKTQFDLLWEYAIRFSGIVGSFFAGIYVGRKLGQSGRRYSIIIGIIAALMEVFVLSMHWISTKPDELSYVLPDSVYICGLMVLGISFSIAIASIFGSILGSKFSKI